ncbi:outer membrane beta-barrel protein [Helicobacter cetorum]|uniref:outer membrane beta-barrel protein n=1 Tax=Helicobacter cetorum TaxID=138563 RepID=UPI000CF0CFBF|nr:outer membrane beta-barrel protein [Helicobacter cetorum]
MYSKVLRFLLIWGIFSAIAQAIDEKEPLEIKPTFESENQTQEEQYKQALLLKEIQQKKRRLYMLRGELYKQEQALLSQNMAQRKSGFFVGVLLGEIGIKAYPYYNTQELGRIQAYPLLYGVRGGYQKYFSNGISGLRFYGEYLGGGLKGFKNNALASYQIASMNLDLIMDKPIDREKKFALGIFGGIGVGWNGMYQKLQDVKGYSQPNDFNLVLNLGVTMTLNLKHRFELALKMPPLKDANSKFLYYFKSTNIYYISYNYLL